MSFHYSRGVKVLWRADGNLFFPSEMSSLIAADTRGEEVSETTPGVILPPKISRVFQQG